MLPLPPKSLLMATMPELLLGLSSEALAKLLSGSNSFTFWLIDSGKKNLDDGILPKLYSLSCIVTVLPSILKWSNFPPLAITEPM